jgi:hypothetical protein
MSPLRNIPAEIEALIVQASASGRAISEIEIAIAIYGSATPEHRKIVRDAIRGLGSRVRRFSRRTAGDGHANSRH